MPPPPPAADLLAGARRGDDVAWAQLHRDWAEVVLGWCIFLGGGRIDADEAAAEVFMRLWRAIDRIDPPAVFRSYLYSITRRVISEQRRRAWFRRWTGGEVPDRADAGPGPDHDVDAKRTTAAVAALLDDMREHDREILVLCDVQGLTAVEAAELLGINLSGTKARLSRARERFQSAARRRELVPVESSHVR
jgi:RNA polymerase sigma-70 factor, ECF subfamily